MCEEPEEAAVKMSSLQVDVTVANRFISSLSKSLQALCHGCMDFDSGIEIVGYININIDSGSKVDYVLNEKVLKSTTNSMTFVSNSFLAKKDAPKQTRDDACSPIPELRSQPQTPYHRGAYQGPRSSMHFTHSHNYRGSQKRTWPGMDRDWRMSPKKFRGGRMGHHPGFQAVATSQNTTHVQSPMSSAQTGENAADFKIPMSSDGSQPPDAAQAAINVKKEVMDNESAQQEMQLDQTLTEQLAEESLQSSQINIKKDPDAEAQTDSTYESTNASANASDGDFKGTFLHPENNPNITKSSDEIGTGEGAVLDSTEQVDDPSNQNSSLLSEQSDANNIPGASNDNFAESVPSCSGEHGEIATDESYSQSVYSDAGEGSNDAGQFEVIEIEDEDEDMQGLFGDTHLNPRLSKEKPRRALTNAEKCRAYRRRLAQDQSRSAIAKIKRRESNKRYRASLTLAQRERIREGSKIRQRRSRQLQKQMNLSNMPVSNQPKPKLREINTHKTEKIGKQAQTDSIKREKNRLSQQKRRSNMTPQRKMLEKKKRRQHYLEQKILNKSKNNRSKTKSTSE